MTQKTTYKDAGVDVELADRVIGDLSDRIRSTFRPEVIGKMGGFAACFRPRWSNYRDPVLVAATDGVGTKLKIAFMTGIHDTVGIDLVAMNVNDVVVNGAEPLFFLDYVATGKIDPKTVQSVVSGIACGCEIAGCSLIGGETAEMPDFYAPGEYDLAGFCVGMVDAAQAVDGSAVRRADMVVGIASSGLHSNGFSLVRKVLLKTSNYSLETVRPELGMSLGEALLRPTTIYVKPLLELLATVRVSAIAHITGGGFLGNIPRVMPDTCNVVIRKDTWEVPPIFRLLQSEAHLDDTEMFQTFNMGIGMVLVVAEDDMDVTLALLRAKDLRSFPIGEIVAREGTGPRVILS